MDAANSRTMQTTAGSARTVRECGITGLRARKQDGPEPSKGEDITLEGSPRGAAPRIKLIRREAVDQAGAACFDKGRLAAPPGPVGGIPRIGIRAAPLLVVMAHHGRARGVAGPVGAGCVFIASRKRAVHVRPGQDVVRVRIVAAAVDDTALLGE